MTKAQHPHDALMGQIVGHYAPLIAKALADSLPAGSAWLAHPSPADLDMDTLEPILTAAVRDAWMGGALIAASQIPTRVAKAGPTNLSANQAGNLPPAMQSTDWGAWTPGWAGAAATISDPGLDAVLSGLGFTLQGLASSTIDQIGSQIAAGVASGASMDSIAMGLRDYVGGDASRAYMIADTEACRASSQASMQTYAANGVTGVEWLVAADPCDDCQANADAGIIALGEDFPGGVSEPPQHPRCRCSCSPADLPDQPGASDQSDTDDESEGE